MIEQLSVLLPGLLAPLRQGETRHPVSFVEQAQLRAVFASACRRQPAELANVLAEYVGSVHCESAAAVAATLGLPAAPGWRFAAPVWLRPEHAGIYLLGSRPLQMTADDAAACCKELNDWLRQDGMQLYPVTPSRWLLALSEPDSVRWTPLADAIGCDLRHVAPQGEGSLRWQSRMTEWQMLLNQSPLNQARQQRGLPPVHSIWLWGEGAASVQAQARSTGLAIASEDSVLRQTQAHVPLAELLKQAATQATVIDERLHDAFVHGDIAGYQEAFKNVWRETLMPLLAALQAKQIAALHLYPDDDFVYSIERKSIWQFWRRVPMPLLLQGR